MSETCEKNRVEIPDLKSDDANPQDDVLVVKNGACAPPIVSEATAKQAERPGAAAPAKKRRTRRGKSKRKSQYKSYGRKRYRMANGLIIKPEAPHNDNQFLLEDHCDFDDLDERLKNIDQASTTSFGRTRDSSFSVDSDGGEYYSSPENEGEFMMQDFNDQYDSIQIEKLHDMSKTQLIEEYLALEKRLDETRRRLKEELEKHRQELAELQQENETLKSQIGNVRNGANSDSADSETDSSDSCSSASSNSSDRSASPLVDQELPADYVRTNGHLSPSASVDAL